MFARVLPLFIALAAMACTEPPSKEMNQAQGAIDAARAAGAETYAPDELRSAVNLLTESEAAVADRDYRLALTRAIESRDRAQVAARVAGENRAKARGDAERVVAEAGLLVTQALARLQDPHVARLPRRALAAPRETIAAAEKTMQEARAALAAEDYARATALTNGVSARVQQALTQINEALAAAAPRRRR